MMKLLSQSLFAKLLIISGSGTTLLLMAVFYGMWQMNNSLNAYEELLERQVANERGILRMQSMFKSQVQEWKNVLLRGSDPKSLEKYWGQFKESEELLQEGGKALLLELDHPEARQHIEQFLVTHSEMGKAYRNGLDEYKAAGFSAAVGDKAVKGLDREPAKLLEEAAALILATEEEASLAASQTAEHASMVALILMGVSIALAFIVFFVFIKGLILRPISQLVENMTRLAGGDFSRAVTTDSHDEIGQLAASAEKMRNDLGAAIREVIQSSEQLAQQAERLSHVADNTTAGISEQQQQTELEATAINEMTATVAEVARSAASAADAASQADRESREGKAIVSAAVDGIENLASEIEAAANSINSLEQESNSISQVLDVIRGIAEQTNLLALNAAIEAARAGEQGRGFAVVADEVRTLASRTQQSTQEIQAMIERLQSGTRDAVQVMNKNRSHAQGTVENAARAGAALESIANAVARINDMNNQIASASEEQGAVAEEINRNIVRISEVAETTTEGAQQIAQSSHELNELARRMRQVTSRFSI